MEVDDVVDAAVVRHLRRAGRRNRTWSMKKYFPMKMSHNYFLPACIAASLGTSFKTSACGPRLQGLNIALVAQKMSNT